MEPNTNYDAAESMMNSSRSTSLIEYPRRCLNDTAVAVDSIQYRGAITLNNLGVALLGCQSYECAFETFKKAFQIIRNLGPVTHGAKTSSSCTDIEQTDATPDFVLQLHADIQYAKHEINRLQLEQLQRLRTSSITPSMDSVEGTPVSQSMDSIETPPDLVSYHGQINPDVLSNGASCTPENYFEVTILHDDDIVEMHEAASLYPMRDHGYAIHIDTTSDCVRNFYLQSSVIMLNYAIAHRCHTNLANPDGSRTETEQKCISMAYKLFTVAYEILTHEREKVLEDQQQRDDMMIMNDFNTTDLDSTTSTAFVDCICLEQIELMRIFAVQGLMHMSLDLNLLPEGERYYKLLGDLHLGHENSSYQIYYRTAAPAA